MSTVDISAWWVTLFVLDCHHLQISVVNHNVFITDLCNMYIFPMTICSLLLRILSIVKCLVVVVPMTMVMVLAPIFICTNLCFIILKIYFSCIEKQRSVKCPWIPEKNHTQKGSVLQETSLFKSFPRSLISLHSLNLDFNESYSCFFFPTP